MLLSGSIGWRAVDKMLMTDDEIRTALKEVDVDPDVDVDSYEANFIESVGYKSAGVLSDPQRAKAMQIIEKYS